MVWDGIERRKSPPATRKFVLCLGAVVMAYVTIIFWYSSTRTSDGDLREAIRMTTLNSCAEGNKLRAEVGRPAQSCQQRVKALPR